MKKQYTWSAEKNAERYENGVWATVDECIAEAEAVGVARGDTIYVGECENFQISVDCVNIFEILREEAYDFADDYGEDWCNDLDFSQEDTEKLNEKLSQVIIDFLTEHNAMPNFYQVDSVRAVTVK